MANAGTSRTAVVTVTAIVIAGAAFAFSVWTFREADGVGELLPAILGPFFTVLGTLSGAVAGHAAGAAGTEGAQAQATQAQEMAVKAQEEATTVGERYAALAETASPEIIEQARQRYPERFSERSGRA